MSRSEAQVAARQSDCVVDRLGVGGPYRLCLAGTHGSISLSRTIARQPPSEILNVVRHVAVIIHHELRLSAVSLSPEDSDPRRKSNLFVCTHISRLSRSSMALQPRTRTSRTLGAPMSTFGSWSGESFSCVGRRDRSLISRVDLGRSRASERTRIPVPPPHEPRIRQPLTTSACRASGR
jgi:hypothetical protein